MEVAAVQTVNPGRLPPDAVPAVRTAAFPIVIARNEINPCFVSAEGIQLTLKDVDAFRVRLVFLIGHSFIVDIVPKKYDRRVAVGRIKPRGDGFRDNAFSMKQAAGIPKHKYPVFYRRGVRGRQGIGLVWNERLPSQAGCGCGRTRGTPDSRREYTPQQQQDKM